MSSVSHFQTPPELSSSEFYTNLIERCQRYQRLRPGKVLHAQLIINGMAQLTHFASKLIIFYVECKQIFHAHHLFDKIPKSNIRGWTVLIGAYARHGFHKEAIQLFFNMQKEGIVKPNQFIIPSVLKACGNLHDSVTGASLHSLILKQDFITDPFVTSSLIDMYAKCGHIENARQVFDGSDGEDLVAFNSMVSGYVQHQMVKEAFSLVKKMQLLGPKPNVWTYNTLISGFSQAGDDQMLVELFQSMRADGIEPGIVSWTSIISGFIQNFRNKEAFSTFRQMIGVGIYPNSFTISSLISGCANSSNVKHGKEIHAYAILIGVESDSYTRTALLDMYAKCGYIYETRSLFSKTSELERSSVTWNTMIFACANNGHGQESIELFNRMVKEEPEKVDHLTLTAVLTACSHEGEVELGRQLFCEINGKFKIRPRLEHYACLVDLLGRGGKVDEAYELIKNMPMKADLFVWGALLGACRQNGNVDLAEIAAKNLRGLEPESVGGSLLLSNVYADVGSWSSAAKVKKMIKKNKFLNFPGSSWM
ncbi:pentatricopeptide repeat-containing protein At5g59600 [Impatiens glandulifera]|uniref:pentatricopeptide repeat-containing protein At5g59600 n=1 Tax=Impatiens glandulifera TaxID=253017 RepID=UPI001FB154B9|nr:pentatricopeptide repeat-containing protein At5g59600 [Impatiens glandulifera]